MSTTGIFSPMMLCLADYTINTSIGNGNKTCQLYNCISYDHNIVSLQVQYIDIIKLQKYVETTVNLILMRN